LSNAKHAARGDYPATAQSIAKQAGLANAEKVITGGELDTMSDEDNRSWKRSVFAMLRVPNPALPWVVLGACTFLALVLLAPVVQKLFHFAPLHATDVLFSLSAGVACVLWFELVKLVKRRLA
jgi:hypothetical protein